MERLLMKYPDPKLEFTNELLYRASDDTYLLIDYLKENITLNQFDRLSIKQVKNILDFGTGTGIIALFLCLVKRFNPNFASVRVFASDILDESKESIKKNQEINDIKKEIQFIRSDLFKSFPSQFQGLFDVIIFNPPYLPPSRRILRKDEYHAKIDASWNGGIGGIEILTRFFKEVSFYLNLTHECFIYFISSSATDMEQLDSILKKKGYKNEIIAKKHVFFEDIILNRCSIK
ncbi:MAG: HemK2/MTQ2 family protein methyltransferase [Promethearchaeota archaeon]